MLLLLLLLLQQLLLQNTLPYFNNSKQCQKYSPGESTKQNGIKVVTPCAFTKDRKIDSDILPIPAETQQHELNGKP